MPILPGPLRNFSNDATDLNSTSKNRLNVLDSRPSKNSISHNNESIFESGTWIRMMKAIGITSSTNPDQYNLPHPFIKIKDILDGLVHERITKILVYIKWIRYVDQEIIVLLADPTGEIDGYFHRIVVDDNGPALIVGTSLVLVQVSLFTPITGRSTYLNITPRNISQIFPVDEDDIYLMDSTQKTPSKPPIRSIQAHDVTQASKNLSLMSQRMVVDRNPPANNMINQNQHKFDDIQSSILSKFSDNNHVIQKQVHHYDIPNPSPINPHSFQWEKLANNKSIVVNSSNTPMKEKRSFENIQNAQTLSTLVSTSRIQLSPRKKPALSKNKLNKNDYESERAMLNQSNDIEEESTPHVESPTNGIINEASQVLSMAAANGVDGLLNGIDDDEW